MELGPGYLYVNGLSLPVCAAAYRARGLWHTDHMKGRLGTQKQMK
jgi:hypothetical protein